MLKAMIEKIVSLAETKTFEIEGKTFADKQLTMVEPQRYTPDRIGVSGLDSIAKLVRNEYEHLNRKLFIRVDDYKRVSVFSTYDDRFSRAKMYICEADVPSVSINHWMNQQQAIIQLQSLYIPNDDTKYLVKLLSNISQDSKVTSSDNGVTQTVEAKSGISLKENVNIKPLVNLVPFRTFLEVKQPESSFLVRVDSNGDIGLFEADGGVWKLEATRNIAAYFEEALADMISDGKVVVIR